MPLDLPMYIIFGEQPISYERLKDGGGIILGWDFVKKEMNLESADWDDIVGIQSGSVQRNKSFSEGDHRRVTKKEFDKQLRKVKKLPPFVPIKA